MKEYNKEIEKYRVTTGMMGSDSSYGNNGLFVYDDLNIIASDEMGWEHVSITKKESSCPTWDEMNLVKNLFWKEDETVIQFHPKKSEYVNCHPYCLHLWKKIGSEFELPPKELIGV